MEQKELGSGTFGTVVESTIPVAIKKFRSKLEFERETKYLKDIQHENIIRYYYTFDTCIVMEKADRNLYDYIHKESKGLSNEKRQNLMYQCANGVSYLHNLKPTIVHRDLKPANILLTDNDSKVKICDFGSVREREETMSINVGTKVYCAPEVTSSWKYTEKCDIYSFGIILWEVMSGKIPKDANKQPPLQHVIYSTNNEFMRSMISFCCDKDANIRPPMEMLRYCLELDLGNLKELNSIDTCGEIKK